MAAMSDQKHTAGEMGGVIEAFFKTVSFEVGGRDDERPGLTVSECYRAGVVASTDRGGYPKSSSSA